MRARTISQCYNSNTNTYYSNTYPYIIKQPSLLRLLGVCMALLSRGWFSAPVSPIFLPSWPRPLITFPFPSEFPGAILSVPIWSTFVISFATKSSATACASSASASRSGGDWIKFKLQIRTPYESPSVHVYSIPYSELSTVTYSLLCNTDSDSHSVTVLT
jgi:hypothetical protein